MNPLKKIAQFFNSTGNWDATRDTVNRSIYMIPAANDAGKEFTQGDRLKLIRLSRYLRNNLGITEGLITEISRYSVGTGLNIQAQSGDAAWDEAAESWFHDWMEAADITGAFGLEQLFDIYCQAEHQDGEVYVLKTVAGGRPALQTIYSHSFFSQKDDTRYVDGIRYDKTTGKPLAYLLNGEREIPANSIIPIRDPRPNVLRGVPKIAHASNNLFDLRDILSFEKQGVKLNSAIAAVLKQAGGNATGNRFTGGATQSVSGNGVLTLEQVLGGGNIPKIGPADTFDIHRSDKTSPTFNGFLEFLIRDVATGFGVPYEFAWNAEKMSGPGQRFIMSKAQRRFDQIQNNYRPVAKQIWQYAIAGAIESRQLTAVPGWYRCEALWPKKATIDFGRDSREDRENIKSGLKTLKQYIGENGKDWREHLKQVKEERELMAEMGLTYSEDSQILENEKNLVDTE
jgi:capsid protein